MTIAELIAAIRRTKGPVYVPVLTPDDVIHVKAVKADVIEALLTYDGDAPAIWRIGVHDDKVFLS